MEKFKCVLCGREIEDEYGCNPQPLKEEGKCCELCNLLLVVPTRVDMMMKGERETPRSKIVEAFNDGNLHEASRLFEANSDVFDENELAKMLAVTMHEIGLNKRIGKILYHIATMD